MNKHYREISPVQYAKDQMIKTFDKIEKTDKPYGDIRHEVKVAYMEQIDNINNIKLLIKVNFSDEVQGDETTMGAMRRNQIRKELLEFANK